MHFRDRPNVGSDLVDKPDRWPASHFFYRRCFNEMGVGQMEICWFRRTSLMTFDWTMWVFDIFDIFLRSEFLATEIQWEFLAVRDGKTSSGHREVDCFGLMDRAAGRDLMILPQRWIHWTPLGPPWDFRWADRRTSLVLASCVGCSGLSGTGTAPGPVRSRDHFFDRSLKWPKFKIYVQSMISMSNLYEYVGTCIVIIVYLCLKIPVLFWEWMCGSRRYANHDMVVLRVFWGVPLKIAGWFISWKRPSIYGWELGGPSFRKPGNPQKNCTMLWFQSLIIRTMNTVVIDILQNHIMDVSGYARYIPWFFMIFPSLCI
jgi:hypothetical protein